MCARWWSDSGMPQAGCRAGMKALLCSLLSMLQFAGMPMCHACQACVPYGTTQIVDCAFASIQSVKAQA